MNKMEASFKIAVIISLIDGEINSEEIEQMTEFLENNIGQIDFNVQQIIDQALACSLAQMLESFNLAVHFFNIQTSLPEKKAFFEFIINLIRSDGEVTEAEKRLFYILSNQWNIALPAELKQ